MKSPSIFVSKCGAPADPSADRPCHVSLFSCRHKWVRRHQRQGAAVSERTVHQHRGILQVHLFAWFRGLGQATQMHPGDPGVWAQGDRKVRQWLLECWLLLLPHHHFTPLCPFFVYAPGTKPPTVMLKRPNLLPYVPHTCTRATSIYTKYTHLLSEHMQTTPPPILPQEEEELCSECITWDLELTRYPFASKGLCGLTFVFHSVTPGNLTCRYIFHIIFSVTFFFL